MSGIERLHEIMTRLRNPETGCPWDRVQTLETLKPCVLEETYELLAAMDHPEDRDNHVEELGIVEEIFHRPKSMAARQLIVPSSQVPPKESFGEGRFLRITFDGRERTDRPLVAEMVLSTGVPASIVFADTRSLNGRLYGQMILQVPDDDAVIEKMFGFLRQAEVSFEEVI